MEYINLYKEEKSIVFGSAELKRIGMFALLLLFIMVSVSSYFEWSYKKLSAKNKEYDLQYSELSKRVENLNSKLKILSSGSNENEVASLMLFKQNLLSNNGRTNSKNKNFVDFMISLSLSSKNHKIQINGFSLTNDNMIIKGVGLTEGDISNFINEFKAHNFFKDKKFNVLLIEKKLDKYIFMIAEKRIN